MDFDFYDVLGISTLLDWGKEKLGIERYQEKEEKQVYHSEQIAPKRYSFRPENLEQFMGNENAKEKIRLNVQKILTMKPVHTIISGTRGHGKSTIAGIISKMTNMQMMTYVGGSFTMGNLQDFLIKNSKSLQPLILFIDEIHGLDKSVAEFMYPILESFILPIGNQTIRPFCMIGATTNPEILQKKFAPLLDRCGNIVNLEHYKAENIKEIVHQYNLQTHQISVSNEVYDLISVNSRFNPRTSIAMFDDYVICKDMDRILKSNQIVKNSLTTKDIIILKHLSEINKPVGVEVLAIITQQTKQTYQEIQESFLIAEGYISRTAKGRCITEKGRLFLEELKVI